MCAPTALPHRKISKCKGEFSFKIEYLFKKKKFYNAQQSKIELWT